MRWIAVIACLACLAGCGVIPSGNKQGEVRHERVYADGTKETLYYRAPQDDSSGSGITFGPTTPGEPATITASFGASHKPQEEGDKTGQWIFYGAGAILLVLGLGFIGVGKHFKLGTLSFVGAGACVAIAVSIGKFSWIWAYVLGFGIVAILGYVGLFLWQDWKERERERKAKDS